MPAARPGSLTRGPSVLEPIGEQQIRLVDGTRPPSADSSDDDPAQTDGRRPSEETRLRRLAASAKGGLRDELNRRKYARFQEDDPSSRKNSQDAGASLAAASRAGRLKDRLQLKLSTKPRSKSSDRREFVVDILYENQRGFFIFGRPTYSSNSLLNFDPSAWTTVTGEESVVDITNSQVPDPTWSWSWRTWYVDMSADVDEEGWSYSFGFGPAFAWHGNHPWFHSFVRRRRWLRKRVKRRGSVLAAQDDAVSNAHGFNEDYFTIHSAPREPSRGSSTERDGRAGPRFSIGRASVDLDDDLVVEEQEVPNTSALMDVMKLTTLDRKKLHLFRRFLNTGGDELAYLPAAMPEILGMFMFDASRQEAIKTLAAAADEAEKGSHASSSDATPSKHQIEGLKHALEVARQQVAETEFWSDSHPKGLATPSNLSRQASEQVSATTSTPPVDKRPDASAKSSDAQIRGIPKAAAVGVEPSIVPQEETSTPVDQGSEAPKESSHGEGGSVAAEEGSKTAKDSPHGEGDERSPSST